MTFIVRFSGHAQVKGVSGDDLGHSAEGTHKFIRDSMPGDILFFESSSDVG
ncbi:MAG: hypothetical protein HOW97_38585 [Catenulispora sp.]|nr:hypothetical protein [Catenulispora sp.]